MEQNDRPAIETYAIIEEPTSPLGRFRRMILSFMSLIAWQYSMPDGTHPVVVEKATGKKVKGSPAAQTVLVKQMRADIETMSAGEFRRRYLDV